MTLHMTIENLDACHAAEFVGATGRAVERIRKDISASGVVQKEPTLYFSYEKEER